jgi:glycerol kinase
MTVSSPVLAIDQGTTGTRAILYDSRGRTIRSAYQEFKQYFPHPGHVEHDALEIWASTVNVLQKVIPRKASSSHLAAIGITNQRETTVLWDKKTGKPVHPAIVWQDRRTAEDCNQLKKKGFESLFRDKTGLVLDPYFSGTKISWLLKNIPGLRRKAETGNILFGTMDSWLLWKLTGGKTHATDFTNASRTLLFNIKTRKWDPELLKVLNIPQSILPEVRASGALFGQTKKTTSLPSGIPIHSMMGDQQAALYGQGCYQPGEAKNTYGTGCFIVMNLGKHYRKPAHGLLTTLACDKKGNPTYALEGAIFIAGAAIQWLRDGLQLFKKASETEAMAMSVKDTGGVMIIPALTGLGSPYWASNVRGMISGLTRGTKREHLVRATLESLAHQTSDVLEIMIKKSGCRLNSLKVDGGATANRFLMQFQSDMIRKPILVSSRAESTAWGAAKLAGVSSGAWTHEQIDHADRPKKYSPKMARSQVDKHRKAWKKEMARLLF